MRGSAADKVDIREVPLRSLKVGMILLDDVKLVSGALLVARGFFVTESFLLRCANFKAGAVKEPLRVVVPPEQE
jgi:hypothetical protein